jgi:hypothetical protein
MALLIFLNRYIANDYFMYVVSSRVRNVPFAEAWTALLSVSFRENRHSDSGNQRPTGPKEALVA